MKNQKQAYIYAGSFMEYGGYQYEDSTSEL